MLIICIPERAWFRESLNINDNDKIVHHINNAERNYFRIFPKEPSVTILLEQMLPTRLDFNEFYILKRDISDSNKARLEKQGCTETKIWNVDTNGVDITRFLCNAQRLH